MGSRWRHPKGSSSSSLFLNLSRRRGRVTDTVKISQFLPYCDVHLSATDCRKGLGSIDLMRQRNKCTAAFKFLFLNFRFCSWDVGIALRFMLSKFLEKFCIHHQRDVFTGRSSYDLKVKSKKTNKKKTKQKQTYTWMNHSKQVLCHAFTKQGEFSFHADIELYVHWLWFQKVAVKMLERFFLFFFMSLQTTMSVSDPGTSITGVGKGWKIHTPPHFVSHHQCVGLRAQDTGNLTV